MEADLIYTGPNCTERKLARVRVTLKTDLKKLMNELALKHFGSDKFNVRRDDSLFLFVAVDGAGDTLHLQ